MGVTAVNGVTRRGRIVVGENDPSLVRYAGLAVTGELARRLRLVELIDAELQAERRARPVKVRRRGLSPGQLVVSLAESQLIGGEFFSDLEQVRADEAGAGLRTVGGTPSAPTALQRAKDFRRVHCQRIERAGVKLAVVMHEHKLLAKLILEVPQIAPRPLLDRGCGRRMMIGQAHQLVLVHAADNDR